MFLVPLCVIFDPCKPNSSAGRTPSFALATPPGIGAIGVLRLSGKKAVEIVNELFSSKDLSKQNSHTLHVGLLKEDGKTLDEVVISLFKGPKSYTGEDVIEISCHGSAYVQEQVMHACVAHGARLAKPGEFTLRAFMVSVTAKINSHQ